MAIVDANAPYQIVPVVSPPSADPSSSGRIRNLHVGGGVCHAQLVHNADGSYSIDRLAERQGWMLLEDAYRKEEDAEGWAFYLHYLKSWDAGKTRSPFPLSRLPQLVRDRRVASVEDEFADDFRAPPVTGAVVPPPEAKPRGKS